MKFWLVSVTNALCLLHLVRTQTDYCAADLCTEDLQHIACQHDGQFAASCPTDAKMVNLHNSQRLLVDLHNVRRNALANGELPGYQPAARMATMDWDTELAELAAYNVKQCSMQHDLCRNTAAFSKSGQNLAHTQYTGDRNLLTNKQLLTGMVENWWTEHNAANMSVIDSFPANWTGDEIGHFTVMAAERNIRVGCGAVRFTRDKVHNFLLACNYATTNILGKPIYTAGVTGSSCQRGRNSKFTALCAINEVYRDL